MDFKWKIYILPARRTRMSGNSKTPQPIQNSDEEVEEPGGKLFSCFSPLWQHRHAPSHASPPLVNIDVLSSERLGNMHLQEEQVIHWSGIHVTMHMNWENIFTTKSDQTRPDQTRLGRYSEMKRDILMGHKRSNDVYDKVVVKLKHLCFFSVKINISTTGGFRVGFFQPDTNHP